MDFSPSLDACWTIAVRALREVRLGGEKTGKCVALGGLQWASVLPTDILERCVDAFSPLDIC